MFSLVVLLGGGLFAQPAGTLRGVISDESGAVIPGAKVSASSSGKVVRTVTSAGDGAYAIAGLPAGDYTVVATSPGLTQFQAAKVSVGPGTQALNLQLRVAVESQQVTVQDTTGPSVSTDPASNAGQLILRQEDLQALSDDPDDLAADLQALAGPSAGPNGGQIFIDGFTGGRLPPKESIREVRINSNPFSSEYDRLGFGRIEIFTKPGSDKFRGMANFNISDGFFNSRNPYLTGASVNAPFQSRNYGANLSGPLTRKSSFFVDVERREINDDAIINAQVLDPASLNVTPFSQFLPTPQRRTTFSPRADFQLATNITLMARYTYTRNDVTDRGVGDFSLPSRGYNLLNQQQSLQLTETMVVNTKTINETRFQFLRENNQTFGDNSIAALNVLQAFNAGGAQVGTGYNRENHFELQNYTSIAAGKHAWKFGLRARAINLDNLSQSNFGGTFSFAGGPGPQLDANNQVVLDTIGQPLILPNLSAIERYRRTLLFQKQGLSAAQIRALGGGATQFSLVSGNPLAGLSQVDLGLFVQDDWRIAPNFTLSLGLRYEWQTNISDWRDLGPRIGFAWAPGQSKAALRPKTVIRGGVGMFYDRFSESYTLSAQRLNLTSPTQTQHIASNPDFYPSIPTVDLLQKRGSASVQVDRALRAPYLIQTAIGVERQLPGNTTVAVTYTNSRALHLLRSRDINAPLPGTYNPAVPNSGVRPFGNIGEINQYESTGVLNQNQMITNVNTRIGRNVTMTAGYVLNFANSNTDSAGTFGANQYDLSSEYGRSSIDIRNRLYLNGSFQTKWGIRLSPFIIAHSGSPFNIYTSRDLYGDTLLNVARPAFAADPSAAGVVRTRFGNFDPIPKPGETIIPRNYGGGPGLFTVNLRMSRTFGFGGERNSVASPPSGGGGGDHGHDGGGRGGFGGGGMRMGGGGGHGHGGGGGDGTTSKRYNIVLSAQARNLLNTNNSGQLIGDITSQLFGTSNRLAGGFGPESSPANNRRIEFSLRFMF